MKFFDEGAGGRKWLDDTATAKASPENSPGESTLSPTLRGKSQATTLQPTREQSMQLSYGHCAMEQDLIDQGILKPREQRSVGGGNNVVAVEPRKPSDPELQEDMKRYGIAKRERSGIIAP